MEIKIKIHFLQDHLQWSRSHKRSRSVLVILIFSSKDQWSYPSMTQINLHSMKERLHYPAELMLINYTIWFYYNKFRHAWWVLCTLFNAFRLGRHWNCYLVFLQLHIPSAMGIITSSNRNLVKKYNGNRVNPRRECGEDHRQ